VLLEQSRQLRNAPETDAPARLTSREAEVLQLVAEGHANKNIAEILNISIKTVEKHRQSVMAKLNIHETASLTRYAVAKRIVQCDRLPTSPPPQPETPAPAAKPDAKHRAAK
jgi:DNA-binding NarL/FixJ family response regulator